jgi:hypothetical protein
MIVLNAQAATEDESEDSERQISHKTAICLNLQFHKADRKIVVFKLSPCCGCSLLSSG